MAQPSVSVLKSDIDQSRLRKRWVSALLVNELRTASQEEL